VPNLADRAFDVTRRQELAAGAEQGGGAVGVRPLARPAERSGRAGPYSSRVTSA